MDKAISKIAALGVPGLVLMVTMSATGYVGAAALTTALSALGPGGMIGGVITLMAAGLIADAITQFGFSTIFNEVVKEMYRQGETKASILKKIEKYPLSKELKNKLRETLDSVAVD